MKVCIVGASGKLAWYMVQHALDRNHEVLSSGSSSSQNQVGTRYHQTW